MRALFLSCLFAVCTVFADETVNDSVVQIRTTHKDYTYCTPWAPPTTKRSTGSGFVIEGKRILTNAHVVSQASFIEVRSSSSRDWYEAEILMVGHDCDLAVLSLEDESFFEEKEPLELSSLLPVQEEEVTVLGFPMGGGELSVTKGIVSRVELGQYAHAGSYLLLAQIDAPINPGNSGGPVLSNGQVIGVAHQGMVIGQNIGYMIPIPVINHFMQEVGHGEYLGFPGHSFVTQRIRNPAMRAFYGLEKGEGGLLILDVSDNHFLTDLLQPGDILLEVDGYSIDPQGWVQLDEEGISLPFQYIVMMKHFGDQVNLTVFREGEIQVLSTYIDSQRQGFSIMAHEFDKPPTYYITAGLVFQPLVGNILEDTPSGAIQVVYDFFRGKMEGERDELILLSKVLDDVVNIGYQHLESKVIDTVDGHPIRNMRHLVDVIENGTDPFIIITTKEQVRIILDRAEVEKRNRKILNRYFISYDRSIDLR